MKFMKSLATFFVVAMLMVPAFADTHVGASSETDVQVNDNVKVNNKVDAEVSISDVKWRQFNENLQDFVYKVRTKFVFSEDAKVELIHDRNAQLNARQEAWVEYKNAVLNSSVNVSADVKAAIKAEHAAIIREHVELTHEINRIKAEARAEGNTKLEMRANETVKFEQKLKFGLGEDFIVFLAQTDEYNDMRVMTEAEVRAKVEAMGYDVVSTELKHQNGISIWHVIATKTHEFGQVTIQSDVEINFEAKTGLILSIKGKNSVNANFTDSTTQFNANIDDKMDDIDEIRKKIREYEIEFEANAQTQSNSNSGSGGSNANSNTNASASANGSGASASANASVGVGI